MDNPAECSVCCTTYDGDEHRPRNVPCGHTFCSPCIAQLITDNQLSCPDCRVSHPATSMDQFPISYALEALIKKLTPVQLAQVTEAAGEKTNEKPTAEENVPVKTGSVAMKKQPSLMSRKLRSLLEEQKSSVNSQITACQDTQSQLDQYRTQLAKWRKQLLQLQDKLQELIQDCAAAVTLVEQEDTRLGAMKHEGEEGEKQLETSMESLQAASTAQEAVTTINHADQCSVQVEDWKQKCHEQFPDINTVTTSLKVHEAVKMALDTLPTETNATDTPDLQPHSDPDSSIMDNLNSIKEQLKKMTPLHKRITVENILQMNHDIKTLVEAGQVFAVQEDQDGILSSMITLENGCLCMPCLQNKRPFTYAHTLQVSELVGTVDSSPLVYLDMGWDGLTRGRVHIRLNLETPHGHQFQLLCSGQRRVSYRGSKLHGVENKDGKGEHVKGGDYEGMGGHGGARIVDISYSMTNIRTLMTSGGVRWLYNDDDKAAQFAIITRDSGYYWKSYVLGEVVSGLEVVKAAANHHDITQVTVTDCGIVIKQ